MNPGTRITVSITLLTLFSGTCARAQDSSEQEEFNQLLNLLEQQTTLATKTRLNADFVPGMLSVFDAEQLQRRGFRTVWEALASLPGVTTSMDETGMRSISVRDIGELFEPSKIKLLLNGVAVNASAGATTGTLYDTPVEQIERIEFVRGPGSAIHGEFAYAGVINVTTRKQGEKYSVGLDSDEGVNFTALYSYGKPGSDFKSSFNLAANATDGEDIDSGRDATTDGNPSYAPGPINNKRDFVSAIVDLIVFVDPVGYENSDSFELLGYELEVEKSIANLWNLVGGLSLQDYVDDELPGSAPWMLKLGTEFRMLPLTSLHLQVNAVSRRERAEGDSRSDFEQTNQTDFSLRRQSLLDVDGLDLRLGIHNLLDERLKHPAPADSYPGDYPYSDGAMFWAQIIYQP